MNTEKIIDKIQKMLALANDSDSAEAATAMAMAQKLMKKHGITVQGMADAAIEETSLKSKLSVSKPKSYEVALYRAIEKAFGVRMTFSPARSYHHDNWARYNLIGTKEQVAIAEYTATVMMRRLVKARKEYIDRLPHWATRIQKRDEGNAFAVGWVHEVAAKIIAFENPNNIKEAIERKVRADCGDRKSNTEKAKGSHRAQEAGRFVGSKESLHRPMTESDQKRLA